MEDEKWTESKSPVSAAESLPLPLHTPARTPGVPPAAPRSSFRCRTNPLPRRLLSRPRRSPRRQHPRRTRPAIFPPKCLRYSAVPCCCLQELSSGLSFLSPGEAPQSVLRNSKLPRLPSAIFKGWSRSRLRSVLTENTSRTSGNTVGNGWSLLTESRERNTTT